MNLPAECMQKGHPSYGGGRPRTVTPQPEEMIKLGEEMVAWVKINKPVHLNQWWLIEKDITKRVWEGMRDAPEFRHYYEKALSIIGNNYIEKDSNVDPRVKDRFLRLYHKDLTSQEDADMDAEALRKKSIAESVDSAKLEQFALWMQQFNQVQNQSVSNDLNNNSTESTS